MKRISEDSLKHLAEKVPGARYVGFGCTYLPEQTGAVYADGRVHVFGELCDARLLRDWLNILFD